VLRTLASFESHCNVTRLPIFFICSAETKWCQALGKLDESTSGNYQWCHTRGDCWPRIQELSRVWYPVATPDQQPAPQVNNLRRGCWSPWVLAARLGPSPLFQAPWVPKNQLSLFLSCLSLAAHEGAAWWLAREAGGQPSENSDWPNLQRITSPVISVLALIPLKCVISVSAQALPLKDDRC